MVWGVSARARAELAQDPLPLMLKLLARFPSSPRLRSLCLRGYVALVTLCLAAPLSPPTGIAALISTGDGSGNTQLELEHFGSVSLNDVRHIRQET